MCSAAVVDELTTDPRPSGFSSFLCERWWCILLLEVFNFHPIGSMARGGTRAIVVYGHGVQYGAGRVTVFPPRQGFYGLRRLDVDHPSAAGPSNCLNEDIRSIPKIIGRTALVVVQHHCTPIALH